VNFLADHVGLVLEGLVPAAWCGERIAELRGFVPTSDSYPRAYRDNDRLVVDDAALAAWLYDRARASLPAELVVDGERWALAGINTRFRACRYRDGQAFCIHRDGAHVAGDGRRSQLTLQIYLDADPALTGGRTRFYADASGGTPIAAIAPRTGTAIVFDHRVWHDGEAVTGGAKHVLRTDVMYERTSASTSGDPRDVIHRHAGYAWRAIACRDGSIASVGRDGCVRRWNGSLPLGLGSITAIAEDEHGALWCGTRSGAIVRVGVPNVTVRDRCMDARVVATELGAVLAIACDRAGVVASTARGELVAFGFDGAPRWTRAVHAGWAWCATPHPLGIASCGEDGRIAITASDGTTTRSLAQLGVACRALVHMPSGALVVGDTHGSLHVVSSTITTWVAHAAAITSVALDGDTIVSSSEDGRVMRWTGTRGDLVTTASDFVTSVTVDRDGLVCAGYDGTVWRPCSTVVAMVVGEVREARGRSVG
jgi:2OG-Fe(II) oxygenase superfamily